MEYIVEKSTELGVTSLIPLVTRRTIVRPDSGSCDRKIARWRKLAIVASKQCGRTEVPEIRPVIDINGIVKKFDEYDLVLFACFNDSTITLTAALSVEIKGKILVVIGPEGGFSDEEIGLAQGVNVKRVSLGRRVLKSDTAGLYVLSVLIYKLTEV